MFVEAELAHRKTIRPHGNVQGPVEQGYTGRTGILPVRKGATRRVDDERAGSPFSQDTLGCSVDCSCCWLPALNDERQLSERSTGQQVNWPSGIAAIARAARYRLARSEVLNRGSGTLAASALARHSEATRVSHDALGRPVSTADSESAARTWTYNERSEMTGCTSSDGSHSYFYDSIGNRTSSSSTSSNLVSVTHSYTANGLNQYDYVDSTALTYDADGNLTGDGRYSYAYDCENRLVTVTPVSPSAGDLAIV